MNLGRYVIIRMISFVFQFMLGMLIIFYIFRLIPYDPRGVFLWGVPAGQQAGLIAFLEAQWGIDKPFYEQWLDFLQALVTEGSFGNSWYGQPVTEIIETNLAYTLILFISFLLVIPVSLSLGVFSATRVQTRSDSFTKVLTSILYGIPYYIFAVLFLLWADVQEWDLEPFVTIDDTYPVYYQQFVILFIILIVFSSFQYRVVRKELLDVLNQAYIRTARSKGLPERRVIYTHALRNVLPQLLISYTSLIPSMLTAIVVLEHLFELPGLGGLLVFAAEYLDWGLIIGVSAIFLLINGAMTMISDIILTLTNPFGRQY